MAELKAHEARVLPAEGVSFHGITAVAELKGPAERLVSLIGPGFHGITAVAELKGTPTGPRGRTRARFPRHHSRGRIEGFPRAASVLVPLPRFHGITAVAELKALWQPWKVTHRRSGFHGITAVAELKDLAAGRRVGRDRVVSTASQPWPN